MTDEKPNIEGLKHAYGTAYRAFADHSKINTGKMLPTQWAEWSLERDRLLKVTVDAELALKAALASNGGE